MPKDRRWRGNGAVYSPIKADPPFAGNRVSAAREASGIVHHDDVVRRCSRAQATVVGGLQPQVSGGACSADRHTRASQGPGQLETVDEGHQGSTAIRSRSPGFGPDATKRRSARIGACDRSKPGPKDGAAPVMPAANLTNRLGPQRSCSGERTERSTPAQHTDRTKAA